MRNVDSSSIARLLSASDAPVRHFFDSTTQLGFGASTAVTLVELSAVFIKHCKTLGFPTDGLVEVRDEKAVLALSACTGAFDSKGLTLVTARARLAPEPVIKLARTFASAVEGARQFKINPILTLSLTLTLTPTLTLTLTLP